MIQKNLNSPGFMKRSSILIFCFIFSLFNSFSINNNVESLEFIHYTNEDGLPSSYVKSIVQDKDGFIWVATRKAVSRFDGTEFKEFPVYETIDQPKDFYCNKLFLFSDSVLIAGTIDGYFYYFDKYLECFKPYSLLDNIRSSTNIEPGDDGFWLCMDNKIYFLDASSNRLQLIREKLPNVQVPSDIIFSDIMVRGEDLIAVSNNQKLFWINLTRKSVKVYDLPIELTSMSVDLIYIDQYKNGWIGSETVGLFRFNFEQGSYQHFSNTKTDQYHLPHNMVHCITEDHQGRIWIGTEAGLAIWDSLNKKFSYHQFNPINPKGLNTDPIYNAFCDREGNIWLGTYFGGINLWVDEESFFTTWSSGNSSWELGGNVVSCITKDKKGKLWIGLEDLGLNCMNLKNGKVTKYTSGNEVNDLSYNNLQDLLILNDTTIWIATYTGGINVLNPTSGKIKHINTGNTPELITDIVFDFMKVGDSIFIGTGYGVVVYNIRKNSFTQFCSDQLLGYEYRSMAQSENKLWFTAGTRIFVYDRVKNVLETFEGASRMVTINFVKVDSKGKIWIGDCYEGLCCYDEYSGEITFYNEDNGFPSSWIFSIEEGINNSMWVSTDKGLIKFNPVTGESVLYDSNSGIPFNQFNFRSSYVDTDGTIYFGGTNGMISFNEKERPFVKKSFDVVFTGFQLFNKPVQPGINSPLNKAINEVDKIDLKYHQNVFTIDFIALNYSLKGKCQYAYYLEGFEDNWNYVGNRSFATYTNLSPGEYVFHVKGSVDNIQTEKKETLLQIIVNPPFWLTNWAYFFYIFFIIGISVLIYKVATNLEKSKTLVELERREKDHAEEIHRVKLEFFTNISHELKTPLTLILGPISKIMEEDKLSPLSKKRLLGIEKNASRLYQLINQLLEFRKIENGKESLLVAKTDIRLVCEDIIKSFDNISESKDIDFKIRIPDSETMVWIDAAKIEKVIYNLLSNAFKFTKEGGIIKYDVSVENRETVDKRKSKRKDLVINVTDNGKGIKKELLDKIFDRFFHSEDLTLSGTSSGIGLAYVRSLAQLHKGVIRVESEEDKGTVFTVRIPVSKSDYSDQELASGESHYVVPDEIRFPDMYSEENYDLHDSDGYSRNPLIMLVEDNLELVSFMKELLEMKYQVVTAVNGLEGLDKLQKIKPDLIISDVMMPKMNGLELTRRIKNDIKTSHIPVILLTAKSTLNDHIDGLNTGADFYIDKPFLPNILEKNIENILSTRKKLIERFKNDSYIQIDEMELPETDKNFLEKLTGIIKDNISDSTMDITYVVGAMGLSRSLLHMKLKELVDCSTTEFIRVIRLKESVRLIASGKCNISEAAYETGFSSPTYFTRRFKEYYGKSPREYFNMN